MNAGPIGVFDSGLGGLTAVKELMKLLPGEDIIYFGDTGRVPYGTRGRDTIITYSQQDITFLLSKNVKVILAACGTVSSTLPKSEADKLPVPYFDVVGPAAAAASRATIKNRVGILGTEATVDSGSYERALKAIKPTVMCASASCPLFVPLVETGHIEAGDELVRLAATEYLPRIRDDGVDTVILGCTHYPILYPTLRGFFGPRTGFIDPGRELAVTVKGFLEQNDMLNGKKAGGRARYFVSDDPARFDKLASVFLGQKPAPGMRTKRVNIEQYTWHQ